jgi:hypothetical protein
VSEDAWGWGRVQLLRRARTKTDDAQASTCLVSRNTSSRRLSTVRTTPAHPLATPRHSCVAWMLAERAPRSRSVHEHAHVNLPLSGEWLAGMDSFRSRSRFLFLELLVVGFRTNQFSSSRSHSLFPDKGASTVPGTHRALDPGLDSADTVY